MSLKSSTTTKAFITTIGNNAAWIVLSKIMLERMKKDVTRNCERTRQSSAILESRPNSHTIYNYQTIIWVQIIIKHNVHRFPEDLYRLDRTELWEYMVYQEIPESPLGMGFIYKVTMSVAFSCDIQNFVIVLEKKMIMDDERRQTLTHSNRSRECCNGTWAHNGHLRNRDSTHWIHFRRVHI